MKRSTAILLSLTFVVSSQLLAQSPGGVAHQSFWLKGNPSPSNTQQGVLNFNPAIDWGEGKAPVKLPASIESLRRATIFTVYQHSGPVVETPIWEMKGGFGDIQLTNQQVLSKSGKTSLAFAKTKSPTQQTAKPEAVIHTYLSCSSSLRDTDNDDAATPTIQLGSANAAMSTQTASVRMTEFILYEQILKETEIAKIETYLALKYGITLQKNYINALGKTVWDWERNKAYSYNIAGIGRDDQSTLQQKQGTSSNAPGQLVIGIDAIAPLASNNTAKINDGDYLIWGDNAASSTPDQPIKSPAGEILLPAKKWLMLTTGTSNTLATELKIDTKSLLAGYVTKENFCLVIDRSGNGSFAPMNCTYILPDDISTDGIARFSNVHWDTDGSGKDMFSFGLKSCAPLGSSLTASTKESSSPLSFLIYPNPVTDGQYRIAITLDKPTDVQLQVYDGYQHLLETRKGSGKATYLFIGNTKLSPGNYTVRLVTPDIDINKILIVQ